MHQLYQLQLCFEDRQTVNFDGFNKSRRLDDFHSPGKLKLVASGWTFVVHATEGLN